MEHFLSPALASTAGHEAVAAEHHDTTMEWVLMFASVGFAICGIFLARRMFSRKRDGDAMERTLGGGLHRLLYNKYFVDEVYGRVFVDGFAKGGGTVLTSFDQSVIDGGVNGVGWLTRFTSRVSIWWDTWIVDGTVQLTAFMVKFSSYPLRMLQTGLVQNYALFIVLGALGIVSYFLF